MLFIEKFIASQLRKPNGFFGKVFLSRILNNENSKMNAMTFDLLELSVKDKILEIGFGGGALLSLIIKTQPHCKIIGADFSPDMVSLCRKKFSHLIESNALQLDCASIDKLPYKTNTFTKICSVNTLYFWDDHSLALKELRRVLKDNGELVLTFGDKSSMQKGNIIKHGFKLFTSSDVQNILKSEGFKTKKIKTGKDNSGIFFSISAIKQTGSKLETTNDQP